LLAAASEWVRKELCCWLTDGKLEDAADGWTSHVNKLRAKHLLIVLTAGVITWERNRHDFDWGVTSALPRVLSHVFEREPLWVKLGNAEAKPDNVEFM
jgi:hypothetical protein